MKKISILLILAMVLSLAACGGQTPTDVTTQVTTEATTEATTEPTTVPTTTAPELVTLAIPSSIQMSGPDGNVLMTITYIFEEGWAEKESFGITYGGDAALLGGQLGAITVGDKYTVTEIGNISRVENYYDDQGCVIRTVNVYTNNPSMEKTETLTTYDQLGRVLTTETKTYAPGAVKPTTTFITYTYTDTETGSKGVCDLGGLVQEMYYDAQYRQVASVQRQGDNELIRTEIVYHDDGSQSSIQYASGQKVLETRTFYTQVEVSPETAARLPWYRVD